MTEAEGRTRTDGGGATERLEMTRRMKRRIERKGGWIYDGMLKGDCS